MCHIKNRHGRDDADGQLPVTAEDLVKIPEIIANYDEVRTNLQNLKQVGRGLPMPREVKIAYFSIYLKNKK